MNKIRKTEEEEMEDLTKTPSIRMDYRFINRISKEIHQQKEATEKAIRANVLYWYLPKNSK